MPVEIIDRTYKSIFRPADTNVNWLLGNVGVWQTLKIQAGFSCRIDFDSTSQLFSCRATMELCRHVAESNRHNLQPRSFVGVFVYR